MTNVSEIESIKTETLQLQNYISLVISEIELKERVNEIKQNFESSSDSEQITMPILDRISKITSEKLDLEQELHLN